MARRPDPTARAILKKIGIDPVRELADAALKLEPGDPARLDIMRELLPWCYYKPRAPVELPEGVKPGKTIVVIGGADG